MREVNDGLVRWRNTLRQIQVGNDALASVGRVKRDSFAAPIRRAVVLRFDFCVEWCPVIGIKTLVDSKDSLRYRLHISIIRGSNAYRRHERLGYSSRVQIFHQADTVS